MNKTRDSNNKVLHLIDEILDNMNIKKVSQMDKDEIVKEIQENNKPRELEASIVMMIIGDILTLGIFTLLAYTFIVQWINAATSALIM